MRVVAALAIAAACYLAFELNYSTRDVGLLLPIAALGIAGKLLGWNRFVLLLAFVYSDLLEQSIRQSMLASNGDPGIFVARRTTARCRRFPPAAPWRWRHCCRLSARFRARRSAASRAHRRTGFAARRRGLPTAAARALGATLGMHRQSRKKPAGPGLSS